MTDTTTTLSPADRLAAAKAALAQQGVDLNKAQSVTRDLPAAGATRVRLVAYIEYGKHESTFQGQTKLKPKARLTFELSGPKHPPIEFDGKKMPHLVNIDLDISRNTKAKYFKLFALLNIKGTATTFLDLLGEGYKAVVVHRKYPKKGEDRANEATWTGVAVELHDKKAGAYTFSSPRYELVNEDGPTGEYADLKIDPPLTELKWFLWDNPTKEDWDALYIPGEYEERKNDKGEVVAKAASKNFHQIKIAKAANFLGSPIDALLRQAKVNVDILTAAGVDAETAEDDAEDDDAPAAKPAAKPAAEVPTGKAADDALAGIVP